jgi:hypothetical protein
MDDQIEKKSIGHNNAEVEQLSFDDGAVEQFQVIVRVLTHCGENTCSKNRSSIGHVLGYLFSSSELANEFSHRILPIMVVAYMMAFLDKQTLSYTSLMGLLQDLDLTGNQYSWAGGIFYFGYLFFS